MGARQARVRNKWREGYLLASVQYTRDSYWRLIHTAGQSLRRPSVIPFNISTVRATLDSFFSLSFDIYVEAYRRPSSISTVYVRIRKPHRHRRRCDAFGFAIYAIYEMYVQTRPLPTPRSALLDLAEAKASYSNEYLIKYSYNWQSKCEQVVDRLQDKYITCEST